MLLESEVTHEKDWLCFVILSMAMPVASPMLRAHISVSRVKSSCVKCPHHRWSIPLPAEKTCYRMRPAFQSLRRTIALVAPTITSAVPSTAAHRSQNGFDRPELIKLIKGILAEKAATAGSIDILIPGSADTGILATAAHAAAVLGQAVLDRCRFTVIDRCPTPLILCSEFGARHHLNCGYPAR